MTVTSGSAAGRAQLAAIEESGWGQPFRLLQPHNAAFWVYLLGVGTGGLTMLRYFSRGGGFYGPALAAGVLLFGVYLVPWLVLLCRHNRYTSQPPGLLATAFVWGGVAATFWVSLPANSFLLEVWSKLGGTSFAYRWAAGLTAPINEEWSKALGLVLLIGLAPRLVRSAYDGFIIGAFIGLGFEVFEDVLYAFNSATSTYGVGQVGAALKIFLLRGATGVVSHALFSAIFCTGVMWVLGRVRGERRVARGVLAMLTAMVFHFAWDDVTGLSGGVPAVADVLPFVLAAVELPVLFLVLRQAAARERSWTRDLLGPEVESGLVSPALLDAVSGLRRDRRAYARQLHSRRAARHAVEAVHDLAHALAGSGATDTPAVVHARAELRRVTARNGGSSVMAS
ncbi:PrsW family intramembrane metalloprotease [Actinoplanes siamensis]|uniref:Protease PrsW n=1 Tax=Actinoplanes siamensis TaxID=1223317 RepID=A0A919KBP3_9ACTN|nr:PrsW family intramembrane metalloprotease [Actinoplanes siamensis]GIF02493.1 protease PrsW [Actinoplanes siamensis]